VEALMQGEGGDGYGDAGEVGLRVKMRF